MILSLITVQSIDRERVWIYIAHNLLNISTVRNGGKMKSKVWLIIWAENRACTPDQFRTFRNSAMNGLLLRDDTCPHYTYSIATRILAHSRKGVNVLEGGVSTRSRFSRQHIHRWGLLSSSSEDRWVGGRMTRTLWRCCLLWSEGQ